MHKQELDQKAKLRNGKVTGHDSLHALLSRDADTNVRHLNHADIVRAIPLEQKGERKKKGWVMSKPRWVQMLCR